MKIYVVKISDITDKELNKLSQLISLERRIKIEKFINKKDKIRTLIGEILIRTTIIKELGIDNKYIKFKKNYYGKPYLKDYPKFNFNISHSGNYVAYAISNNPIGVDIEEIKNIEYEEIAKSFFTTREVNYISNQNLDNQLSKFYFIWTLKESFVKCCGQGLAIPLKEFSIDIDQSENIKVIVNNEYKEYTFKKFCIEPSYKMAVCSLNEKITDNVKNINQNDLVEYFFEFTQKKGHK